MLHRSFGSVVMILLGVASLGSAAELRPEWDDPAVIRVNAEKSRATFMAYPSVEAARAGEKSASPWVLSLDGQWRFLLSPDPAHLPDRASSSPTTTMRPGPRSASLPTGRSKASTSRSTRTSGIPSTSTSRRPAFPA